MDDGHARVVAEAPQGFARPADPDLDRPLRIQRPFLDRHFERPAVMVFMPEEFRPGVAMGIEMHHGERLTVHPCQRFEDRQGDRMVAAGGKRQDPGGGDAVEIALDIGDRLVEVVDPLDVDIAEIRHFREIVGAHLGLVIGHPQKGGLIAQMARPVARPGTIGDAPVERNSDDADIDTFLTLFALAKRTAHEGGDSGIARTVFLAPCFFAIIVYADLRRRFFCHFGYPLLLRAESVFRFDGSLGEWLRYFRTSWFRTLQFFPVERKSR